MIQKTQIQIQSNSNGSRLEKIEKAGFKNGHHSKFYMINKDWYVGEWKNNLKHGKIYNETIILKYFIKY
jgi:hypothetical protein